MVSTKIPADVVEIIDYHAVRQLLCRAAWVRKAIIAQLELDAAANASARPDIFELDRGMG